MNRMGAEMHGARVAVAALGAAALTFLATRDSGAGRDGRPPGRYEMVTSGSSLFRLNTSTGEIVVCRSAQTLPPTVTCGWEASDRAKLEELARRADEEEAARSIE